jgi:hypothetical protein
LQDAWANQIEDDSHHTGLGFKFGRGPAEIHEYYVAISEVFALIEQDAALPDLLLDEIAQRYATIKKILPRG